MTVENEEQYQEPEPSKKLSFSQDVLKQAARANRKSWKNAMLEFTKIREKAFRNSEIVSDAEIKRHHENFHRGWQMKGRHIDAALEFDLEFLDKENPFVPDKSIFDDDFEPEIEKQERRKVCKKQKRDRAALAIASGAVGGQFGVPRIIRRQLNQQLLKNKSVERYQRSHIIIGKNGEKFPLTNQHDRKMAEFRSTCKGMQTESLKLGMVCSMFVVTAPAEYHSNPSNGNCAWNGMLPDDLFDLWQVEWAKLRVYFGRANIPLIGMWSRETNKDATPHLNYILWHTPASDTKILNLINKFMRLGGTNSKQIVAKRIDLVRRYEDGKYSDIANYMSKGFANKQITFENIQTGNGLSPEDKYSLEEQHLASCFAYRRWGFLGIPSLTPYRSLRGLAKMPETTSLPLKEIWEAARSGDFAKYIELNGGLGISEKKRPFSNIYESSGTGKSKVVIGVREKSTNAELITKEIGYFELIKTSKSIVQQTN